MPPTNWRAIACQRNFSNNIKSAPRSYRLQEISFPSGRTEMLSPSVPENLVHRSQYCQSSGCRIEALHRDTFPLLLALSNIKEVDSILNTGPEACLHRW